MLTDPIADMLTRIRNANKAMKDTAEMPTSRIKEEIARVLKDEGYIKDFRVVEVEGQPYSTLIVELKFGRNRQRVITGVKRVSRPGRRVYARKDRLPRTLIANMVEGVTKGFEKHLEIQGVGYRASLRGSDLELNVGYSHSVVIKPRPGITFEVPAPTQVIVKGTNKQQVGQTAAEIRAVRKPEPYKGKGIRYRDEFVRRKVGKRA